MRLDGLPVGRLVVSWMDASGGLWTCAAIAALSWASSCFRERTSPVSSEVLLEMVLVSISGGTVGHCDCPSRIACMAAFCARTAARWLSLDAMVAWASASAAVAELAMPALWQLACSSRYSE